MSAPFKRALRTLLQALSASLIIQVLVVLFGWSLSNEQQVVLGLALTPLITFLQNALEANGSIPTVLNPKPEEAARAKPQGPY